MHVEEKRALVLLRQKAGRREFRNAEDAARADQDQQHRQQTDPQQTSHDRAVTVTNAVDRPQHQRHRPALPGLVAEENGAKRGRQRQRVQCRYQHGNADGDGELAKQLAGNAGNEGDRHENRKEHQPDRDDRTGDLVHRLERGLSRAEIRLLLHNALDVLDNDDRIIDDDADRQHHRQQGDRIGGIADQQQQRESADQADRNRDRRNDGGTQIAEEQKHHGDHEDEGLAQRPQHLVNGIVDENGRVVDDARLEPRRKPRAQPVQRPADGGRGLDGIGIRREIERDADGRPAVDARFGILVLRAHFDAGDVADAKDGAVRIGTQHDPAELFRRRQRALGLHIDLELLVVADRPRADATNRRLNVLGLDGLITSDGARLRLVRRWVSNQMRME